MTVHLKCPNETTEPHTLMGFQTVKHLFSEGQHKSNSQIKCTFICQTLNFLLFKWQASLLSEKPECLCNKRD